jgi:hypothetical protein
MKRTFDETSDGEEIVTNAPRSKNSSLRITATVYNIDTDESFYRVRYRDCEVDRP